MCEQVISWRICWPREGSPRCNGCHCYTCGKYSNSMILMMSAAYITNTFHAPFLLWSKRWRKRWRKQKVLIKCGTGISQDYWNQVAFWVIYFPWIGCAIMVSRTPKARGTFQQECSTKCKQRATSCTRTQFPPGRGAIFKSCEKNCETITSIDKELSKMHEAEVHVFSDSVPCLGKSAMTTPEIKFTERWKEHLECYKVHSTYFLVQRRTR